MLDAPATRRSAAPVARVVSSMLLVILLALPMGCSSSAPSPSSPTGGTVGPGGGTVSGAGSVSGSQVAVPAGALAGATAITIQQGTPISQSGYRAAGPAVACGPAGTVFATPVSVTIPVALPAGSSITSVAVLKRDALGVVALIPTARDAAAGTVTVQVTSFSEFQAQVPVAVTYAGSASGGTGTWGAGNQGSFICRCSAMEFSAAVTMSVTTEPDASVQGTAHAVIQGAAVPSSCTNLVPTINPDACSPGATRMGSFDDTQPVSGKASDIRWALSRSMCAGGHNATATFQGRVQGETIVGTITMAGTCLPDYHWELNGSLPITLAKQ